MMNLYYEVLWLDKKRGCRFKFTMEKTKKLSILGDVDVDFKGAENTARFDRQSDIKLTKDEKQYIVSYVLKYIEL